MSDEIHLEGLGLKPGVLDRIVTLATAQVEGVASICGQGLAGLVQKGNLAKAVVVEVAEDGSIAVDIHVELEYGRSLPTVARSVQESIAGALRSQIGAPVSSVDVYVDAVVFAG